MYARRSAQPLGWVQAIPVAISTAEEIGHLFSGGGVSLADRIKTRIAWTVQMAQSGSTLAAAIVYGGSREPSVNAQERQGWADVQSAVPPETMAAARQRYPNGYWPSGQPDFYTDTTGPTHATIVREVNAAVAANDGATAGGYGGGGFVQTSNGGVQLLPASRTTAGFNWVPFAIGGALIFFVLPQITQPSRRRR